jgi:hypothetical protein
VGYFCKKKVFFFGLEQVFNLCTIQILKKFHKNISLKKSPLPAFSNIKTKNIIILLTCSMRRFQPSGKSGGFVATQS